MKDQYESEIVMLLKALLWKFTIWDHSTSYGGLLENLRLVDGRKHNAKRGVLRSPSNAQKIALGILTVFGDYGWRKFKDFLSQQDSDSEVSFLRLRNLKPDVLIIRIQHGD